ncbi:MAG: hypothetical protein KC496_03220 [Anaerolineae bacterium]|nr:hypothetical protein [Anaerolineae bacterium]
MMNEMNQGHAPYVAMTDIAFREGNILPQGNWALTITKGYAWVFCETRDFVLDAGQTVSISPEDGTIRVRALYSRGSTRYIAQAKN